MRSLELLESAVFQPQQSAFGEDAYPGFASKDEIYEMFIRLGSRTLSKDAFFAWVENCMIDSDPFEGDEGL